MSYQGQTIALLPGRLRGYRQWGVVDLSGNNDLALESLSAQTRWPWTSHVEARCHAASMWARFADCPAEEVPARNCTCGLYAKHRQESLDLSGAAVSGAIEAWGQHTEIGSEGFRARYARILGLHVSPYSGLRHWRKFAGDPTGDRPCAIAQRLGEIYKVPVFDRWEDLVHAFPPVDISDLLPKRPDSPIDGWHLRSKALLDLIVPFPIILELCGGVWWRAPMGSSGPDMEVRNGKFLPAWDGWSRIGASRETGIGGGYNDRYMIAHDGGFEKILDRAVGPDCTKFSLGWQSLTGDLRIIFPQVYADTHQGHSVVWSSPAPGKTSSLILFQAGSELPIV